MKYLLKKTNYRAFKVFKDNILEPRAYFIPYKTAEKLKNTDVRCERFESDIVTVLSGEWDFKFYMHCAKLPDEINTAKIKFDKVHVPSTWQRTGYLEPVYLNCPYEFKTMYPEVPEDMPAAVYRKLFNINDVSKKHILTFLGISSNAEIYVNGNYVGYSEGSHNTSEYDISKYLVEGENELVCVSFKWCVGSFLEAQDMFRENGIFRDVYISEYDDAYIYDYHFSYNGSKGKYASKCDITLGGRLSDKTVKAVLEDNGEVIAELEADAAKNVSLDFGKLNVKEWNAEIPYTYTLYITLSGKNGEIMTARQIIGFKNIVIDGNLFKFNDRLIKFKGVNHHDTHPVRGYCLTHEDYEKDVKLMKELNVNAVRTSHYPPDPFMLTLCDIYGLYVIDEADIETHGLDELCGNINAISDDLKWKNHYIDRVSRMYKRDKNHACVTMWSLGNEAGGIKNHIKCYEYLKSTGTTIPVHYEGASRSKIHGFDVNSQMYTRHKAVEEIGELAYGTKPAEKKDYREKPFYLCEYAHAMGCGPGALEEYWQIFYKYDNVTGGCIWEWADHSVYHGPDDKKYKYEYTYGGDHGEKQHDGNFCVDGLMYPDRRLHTGAKEMKNVYRPVRAEKVKDGEYLFTNTNRFRNSDYITVCWSLDENGVEADRGSLTLAIDATKTKKVKIAHKKYDKAKDAILNFVYFDGDREIAREQIILNDTAYARECAEDKKVRLAYEDGKVTVFFDGGEVVFDEATGKVCSYTADGISYLKGTDGFRPNLFRAAIDNDRNFKHKWYANGLDALTDRLDSFGVSFENGKAIIKAAYTLSFKGENKFSYEIAYKVNGNGEIDVEASALKLIEDELKLPRFGLMFDMNGEFDTAEYYGRGIAENLPDFIAQSPIGIYTQKVTDMHEPYVYPQDNNNHGDTKYLRIKNADGHGLAFYADGRFSFSAHDYTQENLDKALHQEDIKRIDTTVVCIDGFMRGSGTDSCGPGPLPKYCIDEDSRLTFRFTVKPE